jgi:hypothetical protein
MPHLGNTTTKHKIALFDDGPASSNALLRVTRHILQVERHIKDASQKSSAHSKTLLIKYIEWERFLKEDITQNERNMKRASSIPTVPTTGDGSDSLNRQAAVNNHDGASVGGESANSSSTHNGSGASANPVSRAPVLVQRESKMVTRSKALVILVLLIATTLVATMTYRYTTSQEAKDFETRVSKQVTVCYDACVQATQIMLFCSRHLCCCFGRYIFGWLTSLSSSHMKVQ